MDIVQVKRALQWFTLVMAALFVARTGVEVTMVARGHLHPVELLESGFYAVYWYVLYCWAMLGESPS